MLTPRQRMCEYENMQVWFDREMQACPQCRTEKLQYQDPSGHMFQAQSFREAEDGATLFDDLCIAPAGKAWPELFDQMLEEFSD